MSSMLEISARFTSISLVDRFEVVENWDDLSSYAGQIVAVASPSHYFTHPVESFMFSDMPFTFAYVSSKLLRCFHDGVGYHLNSLLKSGAAGSATIVNEATLRDYGSLSVRCASLEELRRIRDVVFFSLAIFSSCFYEEAPREAMAILSRV